VVPRTQQRSAHHAGRKVSERGSATQLGQGRRREGRRPSQPVIEETAITTPPIHNRNPTTNAGYGRRRSPYPTVCQCGEGKPHAQFADPTGCLARKMLWDFLRCSVARSEFHHEQAVSSTPAEERGRPAKKRAQPRRGWQYRSETSQADRSDVIRLVVNSDTIVIKPIRGDAESRTDRHISSPWHVS